MLIRGLVGVLCVAAPFLCVLEGRMGVCLVILLVLGGN